MTQVRELFSVRSMQPRQPREPRQQLHSWELLGLMERGKASHRCDRTVGRNCHILTATFSNSLWRPSMVASRTILRGSSNQWRHVLPRNMRNMRKCSHKCLRLSLRLLLSEGASLRGCLYLLLFKHGDAQRCGDGLWRQAGQLELPTHATAGSYQLPQSQHEPDRACMPGVYNSHHALAMPARQRERIANLSSKYAVRAQRESTPVTPKGRQRIQRRACVT